jgi:hypothetical protein
LEIVVLDSLKSCNARHIRKRVQSNAAVVTGNQYLHTKISRVNSVTMSRAEEEEEGEERGLVASHTYMVAIW